MSFIEHNTDGLVYMTAGCIEAAHAFTTRFGGASKGIYSSLNLGLSLGDEGSDVTENYSRICGVLGTTPADIVCSVQIHGAKVRVVTCTDRGTLNKQQPEADAMITREAGIALTVFTADCVPILLHDPVLGVIGTVHAGWRGTVAGVAAGTVRAMTAEFGCDPRNIAAAIGPSISRCCYRTGKDVVGAMREILGDSVSHCIEPCGKQGNVLSDDETDTKCNEEYLVDLKEANRLLLSEAGVISIGISDECCACRSDKYWSHRKTGGLRGSQAAIIVL